MTREYAMCAEDIIWRRTRQGIRMNTRQIDELKAYLDSIFLSKNSPKAIADASLYS